MIRNANLYAQQIDVNDISAHQRRRPRVGASSKALRKDPKKVIEAPQALIDDAAVDKTDEELLEVLRSYLVDMIEHSYNPLLEQILLTIAPCKSEVLEDDSFHLFKVQSFVLEVCRLQA